MKDRRDRFRVVMRRFKPFESAIALQWEAFERGARTGLQLEIVPIDMPQLFDATIGSETGCGFDAALIHTDWVAAARRRGALLDLSDLIFSDPPEDYPDGWTPSMLRLQNIDGRILGLPYHDGPECLVYRKDLLERAGERVPGDWEDFCRLARRFHQPENGLYGTVFAAYPDGHNSVYDFCLQLWTRGGELRDANGDLRLDSPPAMEALVFLRKVINDRSVVHPACRELDSVKSGQAFAAGQVAMMVNWFGFAAMAECDPDSRVRGKVDVAPIPHNPGVLGTSLNIYWILSIPRGAVHKETAWRFLRHCASASMDKLLTLEGGSGCRKSTWTDSEVNRMIPFYNRMGEMHAHARELPCLEEWPQVGEIIDRMVLAAIDTSTAIKSIAGRAQSEVEELFARK